jgi:hypothetical protein
MTHSQVPKLAPSWVNSLSCEIFGIWGTLPTSNTKGGGVRGACWKLRDRLGRGTSLLNYAVLHPNPTNKLVRIHFAPFWCWDKPRANLDSFDSPWPEFGRSHHLPPYSILCSSPSHLHPNDSFSQDSQNGVLKLSRFGLAGFWTLITPHLELGSGRSLNQSCRSPWDLSNGVSHLTCAHGNRVDSQLLVVGSQTVSLILALLLTITCATDVQMAHARPFWTSTLQDLSNSIKNVSMRGVLTLAIALWIFESPKGLPSPIFGSVSGDLTTPSKWGCNTWDVL